ncbi:hypothetical protein ACFWPH_11235 [Nocardia sp. NPDC058499]|uniref:hypothetical protein n=1 Tax=Nocardia sp. NPDC058499 TaxID=3346530 RepID=UPI00365D43F7
MRAFLDALLRSGVVAPLVKIAGWMAAAAVVMLVIVWVGNPYAEKASEAGEAATSWLPPPPVGPPTPEATLPPGIPSMAFPPPMPGTPEGGLQPVPTRYGLDYMVPAGNGWRPSNDRTVSWSRDGRSITAYSAVSDYGYGFCPESEGAALARVGVTGRNGVDIDTAARAEVGKAGAIFADASGTEPDVEIRGPEQLELSGMPAIRYTATITGAVQDNPCDPVSAQFDVIATPAKASAEVMLLVLQRRTDVPEALSKKQAETIMTSIRTS